MTLKCPSCGAEGVKVIYAALPAVLCPDDDCSTLWGGCSGLIAMLPFNGVFMTYTGAYLPALWRWLTHPDLTADGDDF